MHVHIQVRQSGGWFSTDPPRIITPPGVDPALSLLIAHLATSEFSAAGIKEELHPEFPYDPRGAVIFGMLNREPPPPPVVLVQQPHIVQYVGGSTYVQPQIQPPQQSGYAPQPQVMAQQGGVQMVGQAMGYAQGQSMTQPVGYAQAQPMGSPQGQPMGYAQAQPMGNTQQGYAANYSQTQPMLGAQQPYLYQG